jgi:hypothetical protein
MTERRFRGQRGWAPNTDYIAVRDGEGYVVHKPDKEGKVIEFKVHAYSLEYCLSQVDCGAWKEITDGTA